MARVFFTGELREAAGGAESLDVPAESIRQLLRELGRMHPTLGEKLKLEMAVAIDGEIFPDATYEPLEPDSEVHFLPPVKGG